MRTTSVPLLLACAVAVVGCGTANDGPIYVDDEVRTPTTSALVVPLTTTLPSTPPVSAPEPASEIVIERLSSPENAVVEIVASGARSDDTVTVDDVVTELLSFETSADGNSVSRVYVADEGAHTVCVATTCGRVYTLAPDAESLEEVALKIEEARVAASERYDFAAEFPEWTVAIAGPFSGTGGTTDADSKTVTIYSNRNRAVDEFTRTILHEWGHVLDAERLTDDERATYLALRGLEPDMPWTSSDDHSLEAWALQPSEDFAEVIALFLSDGEYTPRTTSLAPAPDAEQLAAIVDLVDLSV